MGSCGNVEKVVLAHCCGLHWFIVSVGREELVLLSHSSAVTGQLCLALVLPEIVNVQRGSSRAWLRALRRTSTDSGLTAVAEVFLFRIPSILNWTVCLSRAVCMCSAQALTPCYLHLCVTLSPSLSLISLCLERLLF